MGSDELRGGRYRIVGSLGVGSQGETLDAYDHRDDRAVAIKRFDVTQASAWKDVELAERETRVIASLRHPMVPRYVEHFEEDGALYLVMERIEGESLAKLLARGERLSPEEVERLLEDCAVVLGYLHGMAPPVVHRDIKPGNVLRRPDGSFALVDFGAVRDKLRPAGGSTVVGTFGYMAPEQFQGRAGPSSDVYGVGATAITVLTGCEPEDLPHKGLGIDVKAAVGPGAPPGIVAALERMLEPDPDRRIASVAMAVAELRSRSMPPPPPAPVPEAPEAKRERKRVAKELRRLRRAARLAELPFVVRLVLTVGLVAARLVVILSVGGLLVALLRLLSVLLGDALRRAANACMGGARRADRAMQRAQAYLWGHVPPPALPTTLEPVHVPRRLRVRAVTPAEAQAEAIAEAALERRERAREKMLAELDAEAAEAEGDAAPGPAPRARRR